MPTNSSITYEYEYNSSSVVLVVAITRHIRGWFAFCGRVDDSWRPLLLFCRHLLLILFAREPNNTPKSKAKHHLSIICNQWLMGVLKHPAIPICSCCWRALGQPHSPSRTTPKPPVPSISPNLYSSMNRCPWPLGRYPNAFNILSCGFQSRAVPALPSEPDPILDV